MTERSADHALPRLRAGTLVAGVDVGNSTTEIVVGRCLGPGLGAAPVAAGRVPTTGAKGGLDSLATAAGLLSRLEHDHDLRVGVVVVADLAPAPVVDASWPRRRPDDGLPVRLIDVPDAATCTGSGAFAGCFVPLEELDSACADGEQLAVGVGARWDFAEAARALGAARDRGLPLAGVLVERDEAVLIGNRARLHCPVLDTVPLASLPPGAPVAGEVAPGGSGLRRLADPVFLARSLGIDPAAVPSLLPLTRHLASRCAAVLVATGSTADADTEALGHVSWEQHGETHRLALPAAADVLARAVPPGSVTALVATPGSPLHAGVAACADGVRDLAALDLDAAGSVPLALLAAAAPASGARTALTRLVGRPVLDGGAEARAAWAGACSTPGLPTEVVVVDIGAGTLDVVTGEDAVVVAGAGDLITAGVALSLAVPTDLAEHAKMHPCVRVETPHLVSREDGVREFLDAPAPGASVGRLSLRTAHGEHVPLGARQSPETWHRGRLGIKATVLERGLARARRVLRGGFDEGALVLLAGGGAEDAELVTAAARFAQLGQVATADVAGRFGPRCAVAWGLVLTAAS